MSIALLTAVCKHVKPSRHTSSRVDMMVAVKHINLQMYDVEVSSLTEDYCTQIEFAKVDKGSLLTVDNPNYRKIVKKYNHHKGVEMLDTETKEKPPVHIVLGKNVFAPIRKPTKPLIGEDTAHS